MSTNRRKKHLLEKINNLSLTEHDEIFKMMKQKHIPFTQNKNGVFFNLSIVDDDVINEIESFVDFCIKNKHELDEYDKKINECKISNNYERIINSRSMGEDNQLSSSQLDVFLLNNNDQNQTDDWQRVLVDIKSSQKLSAFVDMLENNIDKLHKKKTNTKFVNAKKKFARKVLIDSKKIDSDLSNILKLEEYIITA